MKTKKIYSDSDYAAMKHFKLKTSTYNRIIDSKTDGYNKKTEHITYSNIVDFLNTYSAGWLAGYMKRDNDIKVLNKKLQDAIRVLNGEITIKEGE